MSALVCPRSDDQKASTDRGQQKDPQSGAIEFGADREYDDAEHLAEGGGSRTQ